jgi:N-acyl-D-amino-acid deacylase
LAIDYLLKNGTLIDGSGKEPIKGDVAVEGSRIKDAGCLSHINAVRTIDIKGLCVCPGFIDTHAHSEFVLLADGRAEGKVAQGITTEINGNCGMSAAPLYGPALEQRESDLQQLHIKERWNTFPEYFEILEKRKIAVNFATLAGHGNIRASVAGYTDRQLSEKEMEEMARLLREAMDAGAKGLSTGLIYPPGIYSGTSEIISLAREAAKKKGIYTTHMRSEGDMLMESIKEVINIALESGVHAHISHLKASGEKNWDKIKEVFDALDSAADKGLKVTCDRYPYIASSTDLDAVLPSWAFEGGRKKELERLRSERGRLAEDILKEHPEALYNDFWEKIVVSTSSRGNKWIEGKSIMEISASCKKSPIETVFDLLLEESLNVGAIFFLMSEENLRSIMKRDYMAVGTDSAARSYDGATAQGKPHPRGFGSCPRVLGKYVREEGTLMLSEAVHKMTGLPADIFHLKERGVLAKGFFADIVVFDPEKIIDTADFNNPFSRPEGIHYVFVNGEPVMIEGRMTGAMPGRILK